MRGSHVVPRREGCSGCASFLSYAMLYMGESCGVFANKNRLILIEDDNASRSLQRSTCRYREYEIA